MNDILISGVVMAESSAISMTGAQVEITVTAGGHVSSRGTAIKASAGAFDFLNVHNYGTIATTSGATAVQLNDGISQMVNAGVIRGDVQMAGGNDRFTSDGGEVRGWLFGEAGNDIFELNAAKLGAAPASFDGGTGNDRIDLGSFGGAVWIDLDYNGIDVWTRDDRDLTSGSPWRVLADLVNVEDMRGSNGSDYLAGNAGNNSFYLTDGLDQIFGRGGSDTLNASGFASAVWVDLQYTATEVWTRGTNSTLAGTWRQLSDLNSVENIRTTSWSDEIYGDAGWNYITYGGIGRNGDWDIIDGRGGTDTLDFQSFGAVWVDLTYAGVEAQSFISGSWWNLADLASIENIVGSAYADTIAGDGLANRLEGGKGADDLRGRGGADIFVLNPAPGSIETSAQRDIIRDFVSGVDKIGITGFGALPAVSIGSIPSASAPLQFDTDTGILSYDADGAGGLAPIEIAILSGNPGITHSDLILV